MMETQFAYGSNMDPNQLTNKRIKMRNPRIAKLEGYEFGFTKSSEWDGKLVVEQKLFTGRQILLRVKVRLFGEFYWI